MFCVPAVAVGRCLSLVEFFAFLVMHDAHVWQTGVFSEVCGFVLAPLCVLCVGVFSVLSRSSLENYVSDYGPLLSDELADLPPEIEHSDELEVLIQAMKVADDKYMLAEEDFLVRKSALSVQLFSLSHLPRFTLSSP